MYPLVLYFCKIKRFGHSRKQRFICENIEGKLAAYSGFIDACQTVFIVAKCFAGGFHAQEMLAKLTACFKLIGQIVFFQSESSLPAFSHAKNIQFILYHFFAKNQELKRFFYTSFLCISRIFSEKAEPSKKSNRTPMAITQKNAYNRMMP